jgi:hypothetical protein
MDSLIQLLMQRYGFTRESAEAWAKIQMGAGIPQTPSTLTPVGGVIQDVAGGIKAPTTGHSAPDYVQAAVQGRDKVLREAQDPLTAEALKFWSTMNTSAQGAWENTRETRDRANARGEGEAVKAYLAERNKEKSKY